MLHIGQHRHVHSLAAGTTAAAVVAGFKAAVAGTTNHEPQRQGWLEPWRWGWHRRPRAGIQRRHPRRRDPASPVAATGSVSWRQKRSAARRSDIWSDGAERAVGGRDEAGIAAEPRKASSRLRRSGRCDVGRHGGRRRAARQIGGGRVARDCLRVRERGTRGGRLGGGLGRRRPGGDLELGIRVCVSRLIEILGPAGFVGGLKIGLSRHV
jgi:hypothetical protein